MSEKGLSNLKNVSEADRKMIADVEKMFGPEPSEMGFVKNTFWGRVREDLVFPYPVESDAERQKCDRLLVELEDYLKNEHPSILIDQEEIMPDWCLRRLFELGVMGMTVPEEYGGLGLGVTSYNRILELIGRYCTSTSVIVSAHQSIGCKAIMLFGSEEQKKKYLPKVAREYLSAFCLSEPQVGSDAAGQETRCEWNEEKGVYILNGIKKWSTSGAWAGMFTVMAKQKLVNPKTGKEEEKVTALILTPDMPGFEIFENNRSKTGIRGTWQARLRFNNVEVPKENLLHEEGRGLNVALTCLNYGRCTLSAGVMGGAKQARDQAVKWVQTRHQFGRPLAEFDLVQRHIAKMSAYCYAMEAVLYMVTGMLDRHDKDIMVETAISKVFCSHYGWEAIDSAMQIMGGEGYVTENEFDRLWRDNRIHRIVEGSNEVMQSFIFAYGGKQLAEQMMGMMDAFFWQKDQGFGGNVGRVVKNGLNPKVLGVAIPLGLQLFFNKKPGAPRITKVHSSLQGRADQLCRLIRDHSHSYKRVNKQEQESMVKKQTQQARAADNAILLFALACALSRTDHLIRSGAKGLEFDRDRAALDYLFDHFSLVIDRNIREMSVNEDDAGRKLAAATIKQNDALPNADFYIHETSPTAAGTGKGIPKAHVRQFPPGSSPVVPRDDRYDDLVKPAKKSEA